MYVSKLPEYEKLLRIQIEKREEELEKEDHEEAEVPLFSSLHVSTPHHYQRVRKEMKQMNDAEDTFQNASPEAIRQAYSAFQKESALHGN